MSRTEARGCHVSKLSPGPKAASGRVPQVLEAPRMGGTSGTRVGSAFLERILERAGRMKGRTSRTGAGGQREPDQLRPSGGECLRVPRDPSPYIPLCVSTQKQFRGQSLSHREGGRIWHLVGLSLSPSPPLHSLQLNHLHRKWE